MPQTTPRNPAKTDREVLALYFRAAGNEYQSHTIDFFPIIDKTHGLSWRMNMHFRGTLYSSLTTARIKDAQPLHKGHNRQVIALLVVERSYNRTGYVRRSVSRALLAAYGHGHLLPVESLRIIWLRLRAGSGAEACPVTADMIFEIARWL